MSISIIGIVAVAKDLAIGKDGKLPWHYPADLKFFKNTTTGNALVMGMNTWQSIGKPLPNRLNIVLSRERSIEPQPGVLLLRSKDEVLGLRPYLKSDLFVIGGARTFAEFSDSIDRWIVTEVPVAVAGADVFMPNDFLDEFFVEEQMQLGEGLVVKSFRRRRVGV